MPLPTSRHLPAQFFAGTALGGDGPLCICSEERRKLTVAGCMVPPTPQKRHVCVLILRTCGCDLI